MAAEESISGLEQRSDSLDAIFWGGVLLWAGLIFGADAAGFLQTVSSAGAWSWIFLGAGTYGLVLSLVRAASPRYSLPTTWDWVWSILFVVFGAAGFLSVNVPLWLVLILIGGVMLVNAIFRRD